MPKIVQVVQPSLLNEGAILMECLPGNLLEKEVTAELIYEIGILLAGIHLNRTELYGDLTQEQSLYLGPRTPFRLKFEESFLECSHHLPSKILEKTYQYYKTHVEALDLVDGPCIIHRDFRPGNIIVSNGKVTEIIDWASVRSSFAEEDFCPLELNEWSKRKKLRENFLKGYSSVRPIPEYNLIMPLLLINRALSAIGFTLKKGTWNNVNAVLYKTNLKFLDSFFKRPG